MSSSCCADTCEPSSVAGSDVCRQCGKKGVAVEPITLEALLTSDALRQGIPKSPRFCASEDCPVVYFGDGLTFTEAHLAVRVHAKHRLSESVLVCYCFGHSPGTIRREIDQHGSSDAWKDITAEVKAGHCACEVKNPKGTCCLGDVARVEEEVIRWRGERE